MLNKHSCFFIAALTVICSCIFLSKITKQTPPDQSMQEEVSLSVSSSQMAHEHISECAHCALNMKKPQRALAGWLWNKGDNSISQKIVSEVPMPQFYQKGTEHDWVLENGEVLKFQVKSQYLHADGTVFVSGRLQNKALCRLQWNEKNGFFNGLIEMRDHPVAYELSKTNTGDTIIKKCRMDQLICSEINQETQQISYGLPAAQEGDLGVTQDSALPEKSLTTTPLLNSYPSAESVVYLDFDGEEVNGTNWGDSIIIGGTGYSAAKITDIWKHVASDMSPFNLNVTTDESVYLNTSPTQRIRCIISPTSNWYSTKKIGGVAYTGSFKWSGDTPCWVFANNLYNNTKYVAEACSHEVGHTLGLSHDGKGGEVYYAGHGSGSVSWAPIMGSSYAKTVTQWSKGEYSGANNKEDDLAIIASSKNGFGYRDDDHQNTNSSATKLNADRSFQVAGTGMIERQGDKDLFSITTAKGNISLDVSSAEIDTNLDLLIQLYDAEGTLIAESNPATELDASINATVNSGVYFLRIGATGYETVDTGYSDYASLGAYKIQGEIAGAIKANTFADTVAPLPINERSQEDDPDHDGFNNLVEYALGTNPLVKEAEMNFSTVEANSKGGIDFLIDLPSVIPIDAIYVVEATSSLAANEWEEIAVRAVDGIWSGACSVLEESGPNGKRRFRICETGNENRSSRFMRMRFALAPNK